MAKAQGGKRRSQLPSKSVGRSSDNPDRVASRKATRGGGSLRTKATINRLNMYRGGKVVKNKKGQVVDGELLSKDTAGGKALTGASGRVQPDRRWFGNTRTVTPGDLDKFREEMRTIARDPMKVILHAKQVPLGLVRSDALYDDEATKKQNEKNQAKLRRAELLANEPFGTTFKGSGGSHARKKPKLHANDLEGLAQSAKDKAAKFLKEPDEGNDDEDDDEDAGKSSERQDLFAKGQSKRIWAELYKVLDCSDVVMHVIDARDVPGTTCDRVVQHITKHQGKNLLFVLNKCDLVPTWAVKRWVAELGKVAPTVAFKATRSKTFGKGAVLDVLKQFAKLLRDKTSISVGVVGYPNVGKSSLINALRSKKVCKVAPIPGETKVWQYVTLTKKVHLIDSPGVVYDKEKQDDVDAVLKGVVRAERLPDPTVFIPKLIEKCYDLDHLHNTYGAGLLKLSNDVHAAHRAGLTTGLTSGRKGPDNVAFAGPDALDTAADTFLSNLARKMGRLLPGGEPDLRTVAVALINDWQRGKIPHFVPPPDLPGDDDEKKSSQPDKDDDGPTPGISAE